MLPKGAGEQEKGRGLNQFIINGRYTRMNADFVGSILFTFDMFLAPTHKIYSISSGAKPTPKYNQ